MVDAARVGHPPAGGLEVDPEVVEDREGAADHARVGAAAGHLGEVRQVRELAEHHTDGLVEGVLVVAGMGPDARGEGHDGVTGRPARGRSR